MKMQTLILSSVLLGSVALSSAQADTLRHNQRHSFQTEVTRSNGAGRSITRQTQQVAGTNQFQRDTTLTTGQGKTANRHIEGNYDPETKTYTRTLEGSRLNGDTYSSIREASKTENGFVRSQTRTNSAGETASKDVTVSADKENRTLTKEVSATGFHGKTYNATLTQSYGDGGDE